MVNWSSSEKIVHSKYMHRGCFVNINAQLDTVSFCCFNCSRVTLRKQKRRPVAFYAVPSESGAKATAENSGARRLARAARRARTPSLKRSSTGIVSAQEMHAAHKRCISL